MESKSRVENMNINKSVLKRQIEDIISDLLGYRGQEGLSQTFSKLDLSSIQFVLLVIECENRFNINFEDEQLLLSKYLTIDDFCEYVAKRITTKAEF